MDMEKHFSSVLRLFSSTACNHGEHQNISIDEQEVSVTVPAFDSRPSSTLLYDGFAKMEDTPKAFYKQNVMNLVNSVLRGYNGALVSLGLESSDHLSFVLGSPNGILHEAASNILRYIKKLQQKGMSRNLTVPCSYVLIANEKVHDLLQGFDDQESNDPSSDVKPHSITVSDSKVRGCRMIEAKQVKDIASMLRYGSKTMNRILLGMPDCGVHHCAFTIGIEYSKFGSMFAPISGTFTAAVLILPDNVDINALGEHVSTDAKSIAVLKSVIEQVSSTTSLPPPPYSDSVLTRLLQAAFGGNCQTLLMTHMANAIPIEWLAQSYSVLELASKARNIQNKPDKTELAEKALMDAYWKEMRRQFRKNEATTGEVEEVIADCKDEEDEVMVAQALALAVQDGFEDESEESEDEEIKGHLVRKKRISLKPKSKNKPKHDNGRSSCGAVPEDITVESLVALIQDPDSGVPRASGSALVNVQIHRGKGSVFSGASIVKWLLENIDGIENVEDAEQLGQILLDKGAIFHSDGASLFFNAENLFYYARDPLSPGKSLSIEEIRALLAPPKKEAGPQLTLQVTTIHERLQKRDESVIVTMVDGGNEIVKEVEKKPETGTENEIGTENETENGTGNGTGNESRNETGSGTWNGTWNETGNGTWNGTGNETGNEEIDGNQHSLENTFDHVQESAAHKALVRTSPETAAQQSHVDASTVQTVLQQSSENDNHPTYSQAPEGNEEGGTTQTQSKSQTEEKSDQPNLQDLQDIDLVTLERSTNYPHPLHFASAIGKDSGVVEQLVKWYGVDCLDNRKRTPLMFAALGNKAAVCRVLIDCGAVIDKRDKSGLTAVHVACYHGSRDALSVLLSKGANITTIDRTFHTAYHWGVVPANPACLKALMRHSSRKPISFNDMVDKNGLSPLHWAIFYNHSEHLALLIKRSQNLLKLDAKGRTLMTYAIRMSSAQCVEVLATSEAGIDLASAPDKGGLTPLHQASVLKSPFYVAYLFNNILKGIHTSCLEARDSEGRTPLHYAAVYRRQQNVQLLLQFGADSTAKDNRGMTPLELAQQYGEVSEEIVKLLQDGAEGEIDLKLILTPSQSQHVNREQSKVCVIL